jgi:hypothetical protein
MDISTNLTSVNRRCVSKLSHALLLLAYNRVKYSGESIFCSTAQVLYTFRCIRSLWMHTCEFACSNLTHTVLYLAVFSDAAWRPESWVRFLARSFVSPYWIVTLVTKKWKVANLCFDGAILFARLSLPWENSYQRGRVNFLFYPKCVTNVTAP